MSTYKLFSTTVLPLLRAGFPERVTPGAAAAGKYLDLPQQLLRSLQIATRVDAQRLEEMRVRPNAVDPPAGTTEPPRRVPSFSLVELSDDDGGGADLLGALAARSAYAGDDQDRRGAARDNSLGRGAGRQGQQQMDARHLQRPASDDAVFTRPRGSAAAAAAAAAASLFGTAGGGAEQLAAGAPLQLPHLPRRGAAPDHDLQAPLRHQDRPRAQRAARLSLAAEPARSIDRIGRKARVKPSQRGCAASALHSKSAFPCTFRCSAHKRGKQLWAKGRSPTSSPYLFSLDLFLFQQTAAYAYGETYLDPTEAQDYALFVVRLSRYWTRLPSLVGADHL